MTTMKTDTDETIRVTITIRRESHPEWYDRLVGVVSGRARAEIVRTHLTLPRTVNTTARPSRPDNPAPETPALSTSQEMAPATPPPVVVVANPPPAKPESQPAPAPTANPTGGGLADLMHGKFGDAGAFTHS